MNFGLLPNAKGLQAAQPELSFGTEDEDYDVQHWSRCHLRLH